MNKLVWALAVIVVAIWTLLSVGGYALIDVSAEWMEQNADRLSIHPEVTGWLLWVLNLVRNLGVFVVIGVWAFISITIILAAWLIQRSRKLLNQSR